MDLIEFLGNTITKHLDRHPVFTRNFMRMGCAMQQMILCLFPDAALLPSQQYATRICLKYTRKPLYNPQKAALINLFIPSELLHAMDVYPLSIEGFSAFLAVINGTAACLQKAEEMGIPDTCCSFHKTVLGAVYADLIKPPRFAASTNLACDANFSTFNTIAEHCHIPRFLIDVPSEDNKEAVVYVAEQLANLVSFMEEMMSRRMRKDRLSKAIANTNRAVAAHERFLSAMETRYMPTAATQEMYRLLTSHVLLGLDEAAGFYERLANDAEACRPASRKRILWYHVMPFGVEAMETSFLANGSFQLLPADVNCDGMLPLDPQRPLYSMASRLVSSPLNGKADRRIDVLLAMAKRLHADGVVLFCHWGCKVSNGGAFLLRDAMQSEGIPTVILDGDACDRRNLSEGQFSTRLQAFFELLEGIA